MSSVHNETHMAPRKLWGAFVLAVLLALASLAQAQAGSGTGGGKGRRIATPAAAQPQAQPTGTCTPAQQLHIIPEIRSENGMLKAVMTVRDGTRKLWGSRGDTRCLPQPIRFFAGHAVGKPEDPLFSGTTPIPGPTLRAKVGDLVEITFLNQINTQHFANSLDQAELQADNTTGCDQVKGTVGGVSQLLYPVVPVPPGGDQMPNCLHGSSTANIHFHGTHTTPSTTGDNILLFIRPAQRTGGAVIPDEATATRQFAGIFSRCESSGPPSQWTQIPLAWRQEQERLLKLYDATAPYHGQPGKLPPGMKLWPVNQNEIAHGLWPQYQIGAYPYCFRLPQYKEANGQPAGHLMGQSPGTHWYHAHKHGSTALNVANGMTGALIIEGQYDVDLRKTYGTDFHEQVLVIQQLSTAPFPVLDPTHANKGPGAARPQLSVNGGLDPVITMKRGEVQLFRFVNAAFRDAVQFLHFGVQNPADPNAAPVQCNNLPPTEPINAQCAHWKQIAQDGVQFIYANYKNMPTDVQLNLAPANRADLLVKAPNQAGEYTLMALAYEGKIQPGSLPPTTYTFKLLTVKVVDPQVNMDFISDQSKFPVFPRFLSDIPATDIKLKREIVFGPVHNLIDGKTFNPSQVDQAMLLNTAEEWTIKNQANDKAHPFHIHINPFQIIELFEPNGADAQQGGSCYADPLKPETWKACKQLPAPWIWWDTFAIPTARQDALPASVCTQLSNCPANIQQYTSCSTGSTPTCTVTIPGYFRMRSRFVDFTGQYVIHCHILIHEDRGMMQLIEVVPNNTEYIHD